MKILKKGHLQQKIRTRKIWVNIANDYLSGMSISDISKKYINSKTNKSYSREHIYLILRQVRKMTNEEYKKFA